MKSSGITRRVDDLGRIVIPKELRNSLFIKEGTPMEISVTEESHIVLKKCNILESIGEIAEKYCNVLYELLDNPIIISDEEKVLCCVGISKKLYQNKELSKELKNIIHNSENYTASDEFKTTLLPIINKEEIKFLGQIIIPITIDGKSIGLIVLLSTNNTPTNTDVKIMQAVSRIMSMHLSNL